MEIGSPEPPLQIAGEVDVGAYVGVNFGLVIRLISRVFLSGGSSMMRVRFEPVEGTIFFCTRPGVDSLNRPAGSAQHSRNDWPPPTGVSRYSQSCREPRVWWSNRSKESSTLPIFQVCLFTTQRYQLWCKRRCEQALNSRVIFYNNTNPDMSWRLGRPYKGSN